MLYKSKKEAKACGGIVAAYGYDKYLNVSNHEQLLKTIEEADIKEYFEYISSDSRVCMFFDIDIKDETESTIELLKSGGMKEKDVVTIQKLVEDIFEGAEYRDDTHLERNRVRRVFTGLKYK